MFLFLKGWSNAHRIATKVQNLVGHEKFVILTLAVFAGISLWNFVGQISPISVASQIESLQSQQQSIEINYVDMISLMLTGVTIILAALGFVVAILAFVGWNSIRAIAATAAREVVKNSIADGGELHSEVRKETRNIIRYSGVEAVDTEFEESEAGGGEDNGA